jgi:hypothetical protein
MKKRYIGAGIIIAGLIVVGAVAAGSGGDDDAPATTTVQPIRHQPTTTAKADDPGRISLAEFEALTEGMTYEEVVAIIGGPGELTYQSKVGETTMAGYSWKGTAKVMTGNASLSFMDNAMTSKAQFGLE